MKDFNYYQIYPTHIVAAQELLVRYEQYLKDYLSVSKKTANMYLNPHLHNEVIYHMAEVRRQLEIVISWLKDFIAATERPI